MARLRRFETTYLFIDGNPVAPTAHPRYTSDAVEEIPRTPLLEFPRVYLTKLECIAKRNRQNGQVPRRITPRGIRGARTPHSQTAPSQSNQRAGREKYTMRAPCVKRHVWCKPFQVYHSVIGVPAVGSPSAYRSRFWCVNGTKTLAQ